MPIKATFTVTVTVPDEAEEELRETIRNYSGGRMDPDAPLADIVSYLYPICVLEELEDSDNLGRPRVTCTKPTIEVTDEPMPRPAPDPRVQEAMDADNFAEAARLISESVERDIQSRLNL